jgi:hypothetical protein
METGVDIILKGGDGGDRWGCFGPLRERWHAIPCKDGQKIPTMPSIPTFEEV